MMSRIKYDMYPISRKHLYRLSLRKSKMFNNMFDFEYDLSESKCDVSKNIENSEEEIQNILGNFDKKLCEKNKSNNRFSPDSIEYPHREEKEFPVHIIRKIKPKIKFNKIVKVILIPSKDDYINYGIWNLLWWSDKEFEIIQEQLKNEMKILGCCEFKMYMLKILM